MLNRLAIRALFVVLLAFAAAIGSGTAARAETPLIPNAGAVKVQVWGGLGARGVRRPFYFRVQGDGPVTMKATLRVKGRLALSGTMKRVSPSWDYRDTWKPKAVSKAFPGQTYYTYCIVATDSRGNEAKNCARYTFV